MCLLVFRCPFHVIEFESSAVSGACRCGAFYPIILFGALNFQCSYRISVIMLVFPAICILKLSFNSSVVFS